MPFQKGNKLGALGAEKRRKPYTEDLWLAIKTVEKEKKKKLLIHFAERAFENDKVLAALAKKIIPDLSSVDNTLDVQPQTLLDVMAIVLSRRSECIKTQKNRG